MDEKGGFGGKFPKTWKIFKFYHSDTSSNGENLKFCTGFLHGSEGCVKKMSCDYVHFCSNYEDKGFF